MNNIKRPVNFENLIRKRPDAWALIRGNDLYPELIGHVRFYQITYGTMVVTQVQGLPNPGKYCESPILGFHIHEGSSCTGNAEDRFANVRSHYNPHSCPHPYHAGDMPPLFAADGIAFFAFLTDRFDVTEIIGKTVIIHSSPDDFSTQPSRNSGMKIACGEIVGRKGL